MKQQPVLSCEQVRRLDRLAIEEYGLPGLVLMENAGRGICDVLLAKLGSRTATDDDRTTAPRVAVLCGRGNNGGDGLVLARHLELNQVPCIAILLAPAERFAGDAATNLAVLRHCQTPCVDLSLVPPERLGERLEREAGRAEWIVDALLGTGAAGAPREPYASAIRWMNRSAAQRLAVDLPSGLDADVGAAYEPTVRADVTVTLAALKP
ncbi:MAG: NAD(P)H-hydrate epimerase, partial [Planctomycetales bacterium]|nr:NAD(P)H-hydrate epimerase [Planctomycetales bacterium]